MRNLKKILALVLALVMSFSVMTVSSAAFKDQDEIDESYSEAIEVLSALKVFEGYENGKFNPNGKITRAEVAAIIYRVTTGDVENKQSAMYADMNAFSDVKSNDWFAGYVNYCASAQYIKGNGDGTFNPNGNVTGFQALAMILRAIGYDQNGEFTGEGYTVEVAKVAQTRNITKNLKNVTLGAAASREVVAEILFQTIIIPQVKYTLAFGYSIYANPLQQDGDNATYNTTLAWDNFKMMAINGVIDSVVPTKAVTYINGQTINNAENSWENIGYDAHIYAIKGAKPNVWNAITKTYIDGVSLAVTTDGTPYYYLSSILDTGFRVYLNGVRMEYANNYFEPTNADPEKNMFDIDYALALTSQVGVKVDFVDNDAAGKADAIVITHYTTAEVTGVAHNYNSGNNAVKKDHYYLTGFDGLEQVEHYKNGKVDYTLDTFFDAKADDKDVEAFHVDAIICDEELVKGEMVTYVEYAGYAYITKTTEAVGELTKIDRVKVADTDATNYVYTVGEGQYIVADDYAFNSDVLKRAYLGATVVLTLDPNGYVLNSEEYVEPDSYLYVYENEQTKGLGSKRLTETTVVFADGTYADVMVQGIYTEAGKVIDTWFDSTYDYDSAGNEYDNDDAMPQAVYTYKVVDGVYYLYQTSDFTYVTSEFYTAGKAMFGQYDNVQTGLNNKSTLVDVRAGKLGKVYVGHTGDAKVPSISNMGAWVMLNGNDLVEYGFLTAGKNYTGSNATYYKEFIAYHTDAHVAHRDAYGNLIYTIEVIDLTTGEAVMTEIDLYANEYADLVKFGVGQYQYYGDTFTFTSFDEEWLNINWGWDTMSFTVGGSKYFVEYNEVPFYVLNIGSGAATLYTMEDGFDGADVFGDCKAFVRFTYDKKGAISGISEIFVIDGELAHVDNIDRYDVITRAYHEKVTGYDADDNAVYSTFAYDVCSGYITTMVTSVDSTVLNNAVADLQAALEAYNKAAAALAKATGYEAKAAAEDTLTALYDAYVAARDALIEAVAAVEAAYADQAFVDEAVIAVIEGSI